MIKKPTKAILPVRVPKVMADDVKKDAKTFRKSKDGIVQVALQNLFALKPAERAKVYEKIPNKIFGRPL